MAYRPLASGLASAGTAGIAGTCLLGPLLLVGGVLAPVGVLGLILAAALISRRG